MLNKQEFRKKIKEEWFKGLKQGDKVLIKKGSSGTVYEVLTVDLRYKNVMVNLGADQYLWVSLNTISPVPELMNTELYKAFKDLGEYD